MMSHFDQHTANFVLIIHDVEDYGKWKTIFDEAATIRREAGELEFQLLRAAENEQRIIHFSRWSSLEAAKAFFESEELVTIRKRAGVHAPSFHYLKQIEWGDLASAGRAGDQRTDAWLGQ